jgi:hypothetical protein
MILKNIIVIIVREFINYQNRRKHENVCKEKGKKQKNKN